MWYGSALRGGRSQIIHGMRQNTKRLKKLRVAGICSIDTPKKVEATPILRELDYNKARFFLQPSVSPESRILTHGQKWGVRCLVQPPGCPLNLSSLEATTRRNPRNAMNSPTPSFPPLRAYPNHSATMCPCRCS